VARNCSFYIQSLAFLGICGIVVRPQEKKGSATDAKEVGVENATEETSCHRAPGCGSPPGPGWQEKILIQRE
jgi:hypothetical protein